MNNIDYSDINRGLKRRVRKAKRDGVDQISVSVDFLGNLSVALDALVSYEKKHRHDVVVRPMRWAAPEIGEGE